MAKTPEIRNWQMPLKKYKMGPLFGVKDEWHPNGHRGVDYNGFKAGTPLLAVCDGMKVALVKESEVLGNVIVLQIGSRYFGYCHMQKPATLKVGDIVNAGDTVGLAGTTGSASSGVHLHLTLGKSANSVFSGAVEDAHGFLLGKIEEEKKLKG